MQFIGLTAVQTEIVKATQLGESYADIAERLDMDRYVVMKQEMLALAILSKRWRESEVDVKRQLKSMLLLFLCLYLSYNTFYQNLQGGEVVQVVRTRTGRTGGSRVRNNSDMGDDGFGEIVLTPTRTRTRTRTKTKNGKQNADHQKNIPQEATC